LTPKAANKRRLIVAFGGSMRLFIVLVFLAGCANADPEARQRLAAGMQAMSQGFYAAGAQHRTVTVNCLGC
jgi:hypothetical protein